MKKFMMKIYVNSKYADQYANANSISSMFEICKSKLTMRN